MRPPAGPRAATLAAATLLVAGACGGRAPAGDATDGGAVAAGADGDHLPAWTDSAAGVAIDSVLRRVGAQVGGSRAESRDRLGAPGEQRLRTVPNRHVRGAVDTIVLLKWEGLAARYHKSGANQREFLSSVEVTGTSRLARILPRPLRGREGLRRILGPPDRVEDDRWIWVCCPGRPAAEESLAVRLRDGRVTGLYAGYFVD